MTECVELIAISKQLLAEQHKTNDLLLLLIDALSEGDEEDMAEPVTYLSGKPRG